MTDHALDALLAEYVAPPVPAGLAARVAAAALALPQEPRLAFARRAAAVPRRDRRGRWMRRPLLIGGIALGLAVSGAVAATLAGVRIDWPAIEKLVADFVGREAPSDSPAPARASVSPPAAPAVESLAATDGPVAGRAEEAVSAPRMAVVRDEASSGAIPDPAPSPVADVAPVETRAAPPLSSPAAELARSATPTPAPPDRAETASPVAESRLVAPTVDDVGLRQERIERTERLRAARQAQIERLQRVQQRRERLRRLRRD